MTATLSIPFLDDTSSPVELVLVKGAAVGIFVLKEGVDVGILEVIGTAVGRRVVGAVVAKGAAVGTAVVVKGAAVVGIADGVSVGETLGALLVAEGTAVGVLTGTALATTGWELSITIRAQKKGAEGASGL